MAIFRPSPLVGAISGSAGGVQFLTGAGGNVVRARAGKRSQKTAPMVNEQAVYINAVRFWQGLTDTQRLVWIASAKLITVQNRLGLPRNLTGFQSFMKAAIAGFHISETYPTIPNTTLVAEPPVGYEFTAQTAAAISFRLLQAGPLTGGFAQVFAGFSLNHHAWKNARRERQIFVGTLDFDIEYKMIPTWPSDFALPETGWTIYLRSRFVKLGAWPSGSVKTSFVVG